MRLVRLSRRYRRRRWKSSLTIGRCHRSLSLHAALVFTYETSYARLFLTSVVAEFMERNDVVKSLTAARFFLFFHPRFEIERENRERASKAFNRTSG